LRESIENPDAKIVRGYAPGVMTATIAPYRNQLAQPGTIEALIAFIKTLEGGAPGPERPPPGSRHRSPGPRERWAPAGRWPPPTRPPSGGRARRGARPSWPRRRRGRSGHSR